MKRKDYREYAKIKCFMENYNMCNKCLIWRNKYQKLCEKQYKKNNKDFLNILNDNELNILFKTNDYEIQKPIQRENNSVILNNMIKNYYLYEESKYPTLSGNIEINKIYTNINKYNEDKSTININIIQEWYKLYDGYLKNKEKDKEISFDLYVEYNKKKYKYIEKNISRFREKVYKCHKFIINLKKNNMKCDILINILKRLNITYIKLYKINKHETSVLIDFILDKYKLYSYDIKTEKLKIVDKNLVSKNIKKNAIIRYPGNKFKVLKKYINNFDIKNKRIFFDLFGGSLEVSLLIKQLNPNINVVVFENNLYLINFYNVLKKSPLKLINNIKECILTLNSILIIEEKVAFIKKNIIPKINVYGFNNVNNKIVIASWFFILSKISLNYIKYSKKGLLNVDIDKRVIQDIKIDENKILNFSSKLKTVIIY